MNRTENSSTAAPGRRRGRRRGLVAVVAAATVLLVLGGVYVAGYLLAGDRAPRNASVGGVAIGGLGREQAVTAVADGLAEPAAAPLTLTADDVSVSVAPEEAGLALDPEASVEAAGAGRSWDPRHIWQVLTGGSDQAPRTQVDRAALEAAVAAFAEEADRSPVDATLAYDGTDAVVGEGEPGIAVDRTATAEGLERAYLVGTEVEATATVQQPRISTDEAERVATDVAEPAVSDDVTVEATGAGTFTVSPEAIAAATTFEAAEGSLVPGYDAAALREASQDAVEGLDLRGTRDAYWRLEGGRPELVESRDGQTVPADALLAAVEPVLTESGSARRASLELETDRADFSTADAEEARVTEVTGEFTTEFPVSNGGEYRNVNLGQVADRIDNYWLAPGETFSMNDVVGERTEANGFVDGYVIQDGVLVKESGGGVSQGATTIFNAAFLAGLEDVEHQPHTLYFPRYPAGREATVYYGSLDLRFKNDTPYGVVVQADRRPGSGSEQGSLTVKIWSTPVYDEIRSPEPEKSDFTDGRRIESDDPDCEYQAPIRGFDATFHRSFIKDGEEVKREDYSWRYQPGDEIVCE